MLKAIMKRFDSKPKEALMTTELLQSPVAEAETPTATLEALQEAFASQAEAMLAVTQKLTEMQEQFSAVKSALEASEAAEAEMATRIKSTRLQARTAAITAHMGTAKVEALLKATDTLDDVSFKAVVEAMSTTLSTEAKSPMFTEQGTSVKTEAPDAQEQSAEAKMLRAKYNTKGNK